MVRLSPSCLRSRLRKVHRVRCLPSRCTLLVHQNVPMCLSLRRQLRTRVGICSPRPDGHREFCKYLTDSLTGCVGLAANGRGPRRCTAGVTPASVRTWDWRTEARTGQTTSEFPRCDLTTSELATHEKTC